MKNKKLFAILTLLCFMFTLMPVAAFAVTDAELAEVSAVYTTDENASEKVQVDGDKANLGIKFDFDGQATSDSATVFVWFVKDGSNVPAASVKVPSGSVLKQVSNGIDGVFTGTVTEGKEYKFAFPNSGKYTVYASLTAPVKGNDTIAEAIKNVENKLGAVSNHATFEITSSSSSSEYGISLKHDEKAVGINDYGDQGYDSDSKSYDYEWNQSGDYGKDSFKSDYAGDGAEFEVSGLTASNVNVGEFTVKLVDKNGKAVKGQTVTLDTNSSAITLNKEKATTDQLGQIKFKLSAARDGEFKVYITAGSYEATLVVNVGGTAAANIECVKSPKAPIDVTDDLGRKIQFTFSDANGNAVTANAAAQDGAEKAFVTDKNTYVSIVSQPSAADLDDEDFYLVSDSPKNDYRANLYYNGDEDLAEGTYTIKVVLDNGKYVTVTFEVKEFATPVALNLEYDADAVELGGKVAIDTLEWVDANGVTKDAINKVDLAATGYAIANFANDGTVTAKTDDKYVGSKITVVAVDDRYNLTAKAELTVADEATALAFDTKTLAVDVNNKVKVSVVDSEGNRVALSNAKSEEISYVVLDKPEGAKVSVTTDGSENNLKTEGTFKMNVTSNKVGNVTIQAVVKAVRVDNETQNNVVKYYTGTQIFAVGTEGTGNVVVMSIGSNEIIVNDAKATIDAAPMISNNRTFVPFRALAEAFGATVAYDEATQSITAELNGTTVVMTIGSATYTVNGAEKTADVAPFINGSRTMVPVRFVAEAFGIKVIPTYDENGATADILFNL